MMVSEVTPSLSAAKFTTMRCRSTGLASACDVVGGNMRATVQQVPGLAAENQKLHGARSSTPATMILHEVRHAGRSDARLPHQRQGVANHVIGDRHFAHDALQFEDLLCRQHRLDVVDSARRGRRRATFKLFVEVGIVHEHLEHEAVLLGFRQRIGSFLLDRVLRGEHEERIGNFIGDSCPDGDLSLLHRFQQSAACVLGGVRLISSARMICEKMGPRMKTSLRLPVLRFSSMISVPVMSAGIKSGVNWSAKRRSRFSTAC